MKTDIISMELLWAILDEKNYPAMRTVKKCGFEYVNTMNVDKKSPFY